MCHKKLIFTIYIICCAFITWAQVTDEFTDGDFTHGPEWTASSISGEADFIINPSFELQSNGPSASAGIWISTAGDPTYINGLLTWQFDVRYTNSPSSSNYIEIFLFSSKVDLSDNPAGYYLRLGESGSGDGIDLFKTTSATPIVEDPMATVASGIDITLKVTRDNEGLWTVFYDEGSGFQTVGSAIDTEFIPEGHFGFVVHHTSSRNSGFFFDNITLPFPDETPPQVLVAHFLSANELGVLFSKEIDESTAINTSNYSLSEIGNPDGITYFEDSVVLNFSSEFHNDSYYNFTITDIEGVNGIPVEIYTGSLYYFVPDVASYNDVLINEILADPEPVNDLPAAEYIELYNHSEKTVDIAQWQFSDENTAATMDPYIFRPGEYLIICAEADTAGFSDHGEVIGLTSWPSLNNGGDILTLRNGSGGLIDSIAYDDAWYTSTEKREGGWSLERIDPYNTCSGENNWAASEDTSGGTPGRQNSVYSNQPDLTTPQLIAAIATSPDTIKLTFNETLDAASIASASVSIVPERLVAQVQPEPSLRILTVILNEPLSPQQDYTITVNNVMDCSHNIINEANSILFRLLEEAEQLDIVINEILFDPIGDGVDFLEIYNRSEKYINLKDLKVANAENQAGDSLQVNSSYTVVSTDLIIGPGRYLAITEDALALSEQYPKAEQKNLFEISNLPAYPNDNGIAVIINQQQNIVIDWFAYDEEMHSSLLDHVEGVSLERVSTEEETNKTDNWKSAVINEGFATPGYFNSQSREVSVNQGTIKIEPKVIVPDGNGQEDFAQIMYEFNQAGMATTVGVYDVNGRLIKEISNNDFVGLSGFYTWDGTDAHGRKVRTGYYIVLIETFDNQGHVNLYKKKVIVGTKF